MFKKIAMLAVLWGSLTALTAEARHYHVHHGYYGGVPYAWGWYNPWAYNWTPVVVAPWGYSYYGYYGYRPQYQSFAAISYDSDTGRVGYAFNLLSRWDAERAADRFCASEGCRPVVWVQGGCAAIAKSETTGRIGWGWANSKYQARTQAMHGCRQGGADDCKALAWVCSAR